jgi:murein L,D-transpeptidase YcbB/YkuD
VHNLKYVPLVLASLLLSSCGEEAISTWHAVGGTGARVQPAAYEAPTDLTSALQAVVKDERVRSFYEARQWQPAWTRSQASALMTQLDEAGRHGLDPKRFLDLIGSAENRAEYDATLTLAALSYADALAHGAVDPSAVHKIYTLPRNKVDVVAGLEGALGSDVGRWFASLAPADPEYRALSEAYLTYGSRAGAEATEIAGGGLIREGKRDPRVPAIAQALEDSGYYQRPEPVAPPRTAATRAQPSTRTTPAVTPRQPDTLYTPEMAAAVKQLQADFGLKSDGIVGNDTLKLLNTGPADRARQLAVALERRRWLERTPPATRIDVNTAATFLTYMVNGSPQWSTKVINGHSSTPTPSLGSNMFQLVANPPWHVPKSIAEEEILPKGPDYMRRNNMYFKGEQIIQSPGPDSALGVVKFDLKNDHAIYLHDTPTKKLFAQDERHLSHGCVRVENPLDLARMIAEQNGKLAEFEAGLESGKTKAVTLGTQIPVRLLYHTAYLEQTGKVAFRPDVYGWDEKVAQALGMDPAAQRSLVAVVAAPLGP